MKKFIFSRLLLKLLLQGWMLLLSAIFLVAPLYAQGPTDAMQRMMRESGGTAKITTNDATGFASFVRVMPGSLPFKGSAINGRRTANQGLAFLKTHGAVFGIQNAQDQLRQLDVKTNHTGGSSVSYQQVYQGVPVFAGLMRVHFDANGEVFAVNGTFIPDLKLNVSPTITAKFASDTALKAVTAQRIKQTPNNLTAIATELFIFRANLAQGIPGPNHLVYEVEVGNTADVREFVYVDAHTGQIVDQITGIHEINRQVSESNLANVVWAEGNTNPIPAGWAGGNASQVAAWQDEIDGAEETYNLFSSMTGGTYRSYDGNDALMRTVNNDSTISCPNANWNGTSTNYCTGVTGDDTVAHEWAHAYTEYTNSLIYRWQSGALNEAYSDIWGEVVDLLNARGNDSPNTKRTNGACSTFGSGTPSLDNSYRWLIGEDNPSLGGTIRDMWRPQCFGDPGHVLDAANYMCGISDFGGVHTNSGVPNHAFALLVGGGAYTNSSETIMVTSIGITKAAHIHWAAQNMLTPASNFSDHADALEAACTSLVGQPLFELSTAVTTTTVSAAVISAADCTQVTNAVNAVELRADVTNQCGFLPLLSPNAPNLCSGDATPQSILSTDWESGLNGWTVGTHSVAKPSTFDTPDWAVVSTLPSGRDGSALFVEDNPTYGDCATDIEAGVLFAQSPNIVLPTDANSPQVAFNHWIATELLWDGGNVKISVNSGPWNIIPSSAFRFNAYPYSLNTVGAGNDNPMAGEAAFTGTDGGAVGGSWGQSQIDLTGIASPGDSIRLRFEMGLDGCNGAIGWYIDEVEVYQCINFTTLEGTVIDDQAGWPLYASVNIQPAGAADETIFTDPLTGYYSMTVTANVVHTLTVNSLYPGYQNQSRNTLPLGSNKTENFALIADDVACSAPGYQASGQCVLQAGGLVVGNVYNQSNSSALNSVTVANDSGVSTESTATPNDPNIDDGFYALFSPVGSHTFTATLAHFDAGVQTPTVVLSDTVRQDFSLTAVPPEITLDKTVGTDSSTCALTHAIDQVNDADVTYCYTVTNIGSTTVNTHTLWDEQFGILLHSFNYTLVPSATYFITKTTNIATNTVSTAVWTATNGVLTSTASSTSTVTIYNTDVSIIKDSGLHLGGPGNVVSQSITIINMGTITDTYDVAVSGNEWPVSAPSTIGPVGPESEIEVDILVTIDLNASHLETDNATLVVTSQAESTVMDSVQLSTTAIVPNLMDSDIYLPLINR